MSAVRKSRAVQKVIDAKLKGVPDAYLEAHLPDTDDEVQLNAAADKILATAREDLKKYAGIDPAAARERRVEELKGQGMSDGLARFHESNEFEAKQRQFLVMPESQAVAVDGGFLKAEPNLASVLSRGGGGDDLEVAGAA